MLKIKVEQPPRYVSLGSLPIGAVFARRIDECIDKRDKFFMRAKGFSLSDDQSQSSEFCDAICLNDGVFYIFQSDTEVHEVKAELTIFDD